MRGLDIGRPGLLRVQRRTHRPAVRYACFAQFRSACRSALLSRFQTKQCMPVEMQK